VNLDELVMSSSIVICTGSGGVGKTTTAAVLAMEAARRGRRAVVVTIDPAKRLADALGLSDIGNEPKPVEGPWDGTLSAVMLDTKRTFDDLVSTYSSDPDQAARILDNRFYRNISRATTSTWWWSTRHRPGTPSTSSTRRAASPTSSTTASTARSWRPPAG
jgi:anion-transporting  ArsA/GET3 family ATPase